MKIKSIHLKGFKRFTDLKISGIPETARLVVLIGPNGSGKSCVFEAFNVYLGLSKGAANFDKTYHVKSDVQLPFAMNNWGDMNRNMTVEFHDFQQNWHSRDDVHKKAFYIRSSYRHEADFVMSSVERQGSMLDDPRRPQFLISPDTRVSDNYKRLVAASVAEIFDDTNGNPTKMEIRDRLIGKVQDSLRRVFGNLDLLGVGDPLEDGTFFFKKGNARDWRFKNLSGGEKAAFDLLLDFVVKTEKFNNTVFCIDEPELHMHTELQSRLLEEMLTKLPERCQLWISTHSIGTMRRAKDLALANPGEVVFLDFAERDFDLPIHITPSPVNRAFWKRTLLVAIGDMADLVAPEYIVCCEGAATRGGEFDARCFRKIFESEFPDVDFVSLGGASEVEKNSMLISFVLGTVLSGVRISRVVDRDDRGDTEVAELCKKGTRVLSLRHLENFLFDDEILAKLCNEKGRPEKIPDVRAAKAAALQASIDRKNPRDDYKSMGGELYNALKTILGLTQCGNNTEEFCIETLLPLFTSETNIYKRLRADIFE